MNKQNYIYIVEDNNGTPYDPCYSTREEARDAKKMLNEMIGKMTHKIIRYVREDVVR